MLQSLVPLPVRAPHMKSHSHSRPGPDTQHCPVLKQHPGAHSAWSMHPTMHRPVFTLQRYIGSQSAVEVHPRWHAPDALHAYGEHSAAAVPAGAAPQPPSPPHVRHGCEQSCAQHPPALQ
jgi:hypothetical protein